MTLNRLLKCTASASLRWHRLLALSGTALVLLHLTVKDAFALLSPVYLVTPMPLPGLLFLPTAVIDVYRRQHTWAAVAWLLIVLCCFQFIAPQRWLVSTTVPPEASAQLKVVLWTPDNMQFTTVDDAFALLATYDADIIGLIEANVDHGRQLARRRELLPDHRMEMLPHGMLLLHRGECIVQSYHTFDNQRGGLNLCTLHIHGRTLTVALYDQDSNPLLSRRRSINSLRATLRELESPNILLMGDFNAPHSAASVSQLERDLDPLFPHIQAFNPHTWPAFLPLVSIDQVWLSRTITANAVKIQTTGQATHKLLVFDAYVH
jgi:endonuclease/exonuclease/phosphatase (EEP) superfamily protein YafD